MHHALSLGTNTLKSTNSVRSVRTKIRYVSYLQGFAKPFIELTLVLQAVAFSQASSPIFPINSS